MDDRGRGSLKYSEALTLISFMGGGGGIGSSLHGGNQQNCAA